MSDLYGEDILLWSEQQIDLLRRYAASNDNPAINWPNFSVPMGASRTRSGCRRYRTPEAMKASRNLERTRMVMRFSCHDAALDDTTKKARARPGGLEAGSPRRNPVATQTMNETTDEHR